MDEDETLRLFSNCAGVILLEVPVGGPTRCMWMKMGSSVCSATALAWSSEKFLLQVRQYVCGWRQDIRLFSNCAGMILWEVLLAGPITCMWMKMRSSVCSVTALAWFCYKFELFCGVVYVVTLHFWHFCWCRGFYHRTQSDFFLFLFPHAGPTRCMWMKTRSSICSVTTLAWSCEKFLLQVRRVVRLTFLLLSLYSVSSTIVLKLLQIHEHSFKASGTLWN